MTRQDADVSTTIFVLDKEEVNIIGVRSKKKDFVNITLLQYINSDYLY